MGVATSLFSYLCNCYLTYFSESFPRSYDMRLQALGETSSVSLTLHLELGTPNGKQMI